MTRCRDDQLEVATMPKVATWANHPSSGGSSCLSRFDIMHALAFFGMLGWTWWPRRGDSEDSGGSVHSTRDVRLVPDIW